MKEKFIKLNDIQEVFNEIRDTLSQAQLVTLDKAQHMYENIRVYEFELPGAPESDD